MLKRLALLLNLSILIWIGFILVAEDFTIRRTYDLVFFCLMSAAPIFTIIVLLKHKPKDLVPGNESTFELARQALRAKLRKVVDN